MPEAIRFCKTGTNSIRQGFRDTVYTINRETILQMQHCVQLLQVIVLTSAESFCDLDFYSLVTWYTKR